MTAKKLLFRTAALLGSIGLLLIVAEVVLRVGGWSYKRLHGHESPKGETDGRVVLCVGDSYTFGMFVDGPQSYPGQLAEALAGVRVLNLGVPGRNTSEMARDLENQILQWEPELVLFLGGANNYWNPRVDEGRGFLGSALDRLSGFRVARLIRIISFRIRERESVSIPASGSRLEKKQRSENVSADPQPGRFKDDQVVQQTIRDLEQISRLCADYGPRLVAQTYPTIHPRIAIVNQALRNASHRLGVILVDHEEHFAGIFEEEGHEAYLFADGHPTRYGYSRMVQNLLPHIPGGEDAAPILTDPKQHRWGKFFLDPEGRVRGKAEPFAESRVSISIQVSGSPGSQGEVIIPAPRRMRLKPGERYPPWRDMTSLRQFFRPLASAGFTLDADGKGSVRMTLPTPGRSGIPEVPVLALFFDPDDFQRSLEITAVLEIPLEDGDGSQVGRGGTLTESETEG